MCYIEICGGHNSVIVDKFSLNLSLLETSHHIHPARYEFKCCLSVSMPRQIPGFYHYSKIVEKSS